MFKVYTFVIDLSAAFESVIVNNSRVVVNLCASGQCSIVFDLDALVTKLEMLEEKPEEKLVKIQLDAEILITDNKTNNTSEDKLKKGVKPRRADQIINEL